MSALKTALAFAARGHPVLPLWPIVGEAGALRCSCRLGTDCKASGKHPYAPFVPQGLTNATTEVDRIGGWGATVANLNFAVCTDKFLVLDSDGETGSATLRDLERKHGALPPTWTVSTGRAQSRHRYFTPPDGVAITGSAGKVGKGLDIRARGGYVVIPGSRHLTGHVYSWWDRHHPNTSPAAPAPQWLIELAVKANHKNGSSPQGRPSSYYAKLIGQITPEGERNSVLCQWVGHLMANFVCEEITTMLAVAWGLANCNPPEDPEVIKRTVRCLYAKQFSKFS